MKITIASISLLAAAALLSGAAGARAQEPAKSAPPVRPPRLAPRPIPGMERKTSNPPAASAAALLRKAPGRADSTPVTAPLAAGPEKARILRIHRGSGPAASRVKDGTESSNTAAKTGTMAPQPLAEGKIRIIPRASLPPTRPSDSP